ncbi:MAG: hypothetical protein GF335_00690 [Candidatus Moranbacteria bacterium]|nr:hypothetical protein [Candidatus Moranbacteria bacterium]
MQPFRKKIIFLIVFSLIFLGIIFLLDKKNPDNDLKFIRDIPRNETVETKTDKSSDSAIAINSQEDKKDNSKAETETSANDNREQKPKLPKKIINDAPFVPQAPYKNWDHLHNEACEEAAIITAHFYLLGEDKVDKEAAEREIQNLVDRQKQIFGEHRDITAQEMVDLAENFYQEEYDLVENYSLEKIKTYLAEGSIIITPVAGRTLENPYFKQPGPLYHAVVLIGYDEKRKEFITQEPGTKRGEKYRYSYDVILNAIHDFPGQKEDILSGQKIIIVVSK